MGQILHNIISVVLSNIFPFPPNIFLGSIPETPAVHALP
jgi:hypothetical protein